MKAITVQTISFLRTKGGHTAAIINNQFSVVQNLEKEPVFTVYQNLSNGIAVEATPELIKTFTEAFLNHHKEKAEREEAKRKEAEQEELKRIQEITDTVRGMTPQEVADYYNFSTVETAGHWNDLYSGKSGFAILINSHEENEIIQIASDLNDWTGEFGETKNRAGEHHHNFSSVYNLEDYQKNVENYFGDKYFYKDQETEEEYFLEKIKEADDMDEVLKLTKEFQDIEPGYYQNGEYLIYEGNDFKNFFGYNYDVYSYNFAYNFPSKRYFYDGPEQD